MGDAEGEHEAAAFIDGTGLCVAVNLSPRYGPHAPIQGQLGRKKGKRSFVSLACPQWCQTHGLHHTNAVGSPR